MLKGLYTAASGMLSVQTATDILASNLANVNTAGFKANRINYQGFADMLMHRINGFKTAPIGKLVTASRIYATFTNHAPGQITATGNPFDIAIEGDGFFTLKNAQGALCYTRAGNFTIDAAGFLTTPQGNRLQGDAGDIHVNPQDGPFTINRHGELSGRNGRIASLRITRFENNQALEKAGDNLYIAGPGAVEAAGSDYKVHPGMLEQSNVNPVMELINNIQACGCTSRCRRTSTCTMKRSERRSMRWAVPDNTNSRLKAPHPSPPPQGGREFIQNLPLINRMGMKDSGGENPKQDSNRRETTDAQSALHGGHRLPEPAVQH